MDPRYRGRDDFCPEDQEEQGSFFHRGPPPPPPGGDGGYGDRPGFGDRRGSQDACFPPGPEPFEGGRYGGNEEEGYGGRREGLDRERFGGGGGGYQEGGYPPEEEHHRFPHMGFHRRHREDESPPSSGEGGYHRGNQSSDDYGSADSAPPKADVGEGAVTSKMGSLSLDLPQGQLVRIFCRQDTGYNLAVDHKTLKMQASATDDESQHWIKDLSHGFRIKDNYGQAAFSLVNKKTGKVLKHAKQEGQQVLVIDYQKDLNDDNILWTESQDFGDGFKTVRAASDTLLNLTVFEGNKRIRNGSALLMDTWHKGDHQMWKLFPL